MVGGVRRQTAMLGLIVLLMTACGLSPVGEEDAARWQTATQAVTDRAEATRLWYAVRTQAAQETVSALAMNVMSAEGTAQAAQLAAASAERTAEVWRGNATAVKEGEAAAATETARMGTEQANEIAVKATESAIGTSDAKAWIITEGAMTAERARATGTVSAQETQNALSVAERQAVVEAERTMSAVQAESVQLAVERERVTNQVKAWLPFAALAGLLVAVVVLGWRWADVEISRRRAIPRDARGDAPVYIREDWRGNLVVIDADRAPGPVMLITAKTAQAPMLVDPQTQAQVTMRDQAVDLASRGLAGMGRRALPKQVMQQGQARALDADIEIVEAGQVREILDEVESKLVMGGNS